MIKLAVCDNDALDLRLIEEKVRSYFSANHQTEFEIVPFSCSSALKESLDLKHAFQIYFLDILMPDIDGIRLGELIKASDPRALIIYISSSKEYALDAFGNHALRYLVKPVQREELYSALDFAMELLKKEDPVVYSVKSQKGLVTVEADHILYVENSSRTVVYGLADGTSVSSVSIRSNFEKAVSPLPENPDFLRPHKSYFVNMHYIQMIRPGSLILDNGKEIPISRRFYPDVHKKYLNYLERRENQS